MDVLLQEPKIIEMAKTEVAPPTLQKAIIKDSVRVKLTDLDRLMQNISDLVSTRNQLLHLNNNQLSTPIKKLGHIASDLQNGLLKTRMRPLSSILSNYSKTIHNLAQEFNKKINLYIDVDSVVLDRLILEQIKAPLSQLVRLIADLSIETPVDRLSNDKDEAASLLIRAYNEGNQTVIQVSDNGKGLLESTILEIKNSFEKLGAKLDLDSNTIYIKVPLNLPIISVLTVSIDQIKYALPFASINSVCNSPIELLNNEPIIRMNDIVIPLVSFGNVNNSSIVILKTADTIFGLMVDEVQNIEEIVIKPLSKALQDIPEYMGATILGDDNVVMILNPNTLAKKVKNKQFIIKNQIEKYKSAERAKSSLLLFKIDDSSVKALPIEAIKRLDEIDLSKVEYTSGQAILQYKDVILKIVTFNEVKIPKTGFSQIIILSDGKTGLIVSSFLDIIEHEFDSKTIAASNPQYISATVINGVTTDIVDANYFLTKQPTVTKTKHIMVMDDSAFFRRFLPPAISAAGYEVITVDSAAKAIEQLHINNFSLIIADSKSGFDLVKYCKENDNFKSIPVVGLSSFSLDEVKSKLGDVQLFDAFIPKTHHAKIIKTISELVA
jgi:two-component system, chemotaxis family, sensor kinase CheA